MLTQLISPAGTRMKSCCIASLGDSIERFVVEVGRLNYFLKYITQSFAWSPRERITKQTDSFVINFTSEFHGISDQLVEGFGNSIHFITFSIHHCPQTFLRPPVNWSVRGSHISTRRWNPPYAAARRKHFEQSVYNEVIWVTPRNAWNDSPSRLFLCYPFSVVLKVPLRKPIILVFNPKQGVVLKSCTARIWSKSLGLLCGRAK